MTQTKGPVLIELDADTPHDTPDRAPPVPDVEVPQGRAMTTAATLAARPASKLAKWFWSLLSAIIVTVMSVTAWNFAASLVAQNAILGWLVTGLFALFIAVLALIAIKELAAFSRLKKLDDLHRQAGHVLASGDLSEARKLVGSVEALYKGREDTKWGLERLNERKEEVFDAEALLALTERELLTPLDHAARAEVEAAARQVAGVTALVPLALADVAAALTSNLRMIRRIATIYGGRSGTLGSWRLTRAVFSHLVATGAVAVGDDLIEPVLGGGVLSRVSRRFGEGVVNGALTARVGVAAMEVCRPIPFGPKSKPSVRSIVASSMAGLFKRDGAKSQAD